MITLCCKIITSLACILFLQCTTMIASAPGGNGSETTNGFVAYATYDNGKPAAKVSVTVRPTTYVRSLLGGAIISKTTKDLMSDDSGRIYVDSLDTGSYAIELNDGKTAACLIRTTIVPKDSIKKLGINILKPFSSVTGSIDTTGTAGNKRFLQIYGLERIIEIMPNGTFTLDSMPASTFTFRIISNNPDSEPLIEDSVQTIAGELVTTPLLGYNYAKTFLLNTTVSGADITKNILNFPVLVRLTEANFNFTQAKNDGQDIRFTKLDNTTLQFEIERWDPLAKRAEIWVKLDTIFGNDSSHSFTMNYGVSKGFVVKSFANSAAVFDTAKGFQAVWHLAEPGDQTTKDATVNGYNGTPSDTAPSSQAGQIGNGLAFDGIAAHIEMKNTASSKLNFPVDANFSLSAWVHLDTVDTNQTFIFGKGHEQYLFQMSIIPGDMQWGFSEYMGKTGWQVTQSPPVGHEWKLLTGVRQGIKQYWYVDGTLVDSSVQIYKPAGTIDPFQANNFFIGETPPLPNENPNHFKGTLDEVRVMNTAVDADWVRLCYMNQKSQDMLLRIK